jgi:hypothetical protein
MGWPVTLRDLEHLDDPYYTFITPFFTLITPLLPPNYIIITPLAYYGLAGHIERSRTFGRPLLHLHYTLIIPLHPYDT